LKTMEFLPEYISADMDDVESMLIESVSSDVEILGDICRHILSSGGKRLRPLILLLTSRFCGYSGQSHIPLACVLEYIHTATLLHDDVIDHAEIRRGSRSANKLWGNQATILAGDFLLSKAFLMAVEVNNLKILDIIAKTSRSLAEAEIYQVTKQGDPFTTEDEYFFIIKNKTAILIAAATRIGGILGGVSDSEEKALGEYGFNLGIAFQIMDDVLDYHASEKDFGKKIGKDLEEGSITLPFIIAFQRCSPDDRDIMNQIARKKTRSKDELARVIKLIEKYSGSSASIERARAYADMAVGALGVFPDTRHKKSMLDLAEYVVARKS